MSDEQQFRIEMEMERELREESVTLTLEDEYMERGAMEIDERRLEQIKQLSEQQLSQLRAERLRLGIMQDQPEVHVVAPQEAEQVADNYANLTARQRRKLDSRRKSGLKKARSKRIPGASEETVPMMDQVKAYNKEREKNGPVQLRSWRQLGQTFKADAGMFEKPFAEGRDTTLDVKGIRETIDRLNIAIERYKQTPNPELEEHARFTVLEALCTQMTTTLKTVMAANGVNYLTGAPVTAEEQVLAAQSREQELENYRRAAVNRFPDMVAELERISADEVEGFVAMFEESDKKSYKTVSENLPFTFSYHEAAGDYAKLREELDRHKEAYREHKEIIDRMFAEYLDLQKVINESSRRGAALQMLGVNLLVEAMQSKAVDRERMDPIAERADTLYCMMRYLLSGRALESNLQHVTLQSEFGVETEQRRESRLALEQLALMEQANEQLQQDRQFIEVRRQHRLAHLRQQGMEATPLATEHTGRLYDDIKSRRDMRMNTRFDHIFSLVESDVDMVALSMLCRGYRVNDEGEPLTDVDEQNKQRDTRTIEDYISGDAQRRKAMLDEMVERVLTFEVTEEMFASPEFAEMAGDISDMAELGPHIEYFVRDNPDYFNGMDNTVRAMFDLKRDALCRLAGPFSAVLKRNAINYPLIDSDPYFTLPGTNVVSENDMHIIFGPLGFSLNEARIFEENRALYDKNHERMRTRTQGELRDISRVYMRHSDGKKEIMDRLIDEVCEEMGLTPEQVLAIKDDKHYTRGVFRMDINLTDEQNKRRLRSEFSFAIIGGYMMTFGESGNTDLTALNKAVEAYNVAKESAAVEMKNIFNYISWVDLTEDEVLDRADEIVRTEMSMMHLSDITQVENPVTKVRMKDELFTPEQLEIISVLSKTFGMYKCLIRGAALGLDEQELVQNDALYMISMPGEDYRKGLPPNFVRLEIAKEYRRHASLRAVLERDPMRKTMIERLESSTPTVLPAGIPAPLYR